MNRGLANELYELLEKTVLKDRVFDKQAIIRAYWEKEQSSDLFSKRVFYPEWVKTRRGRELRIGLQGYDCEYFSLLFTPQKLTDYSYNYVFCGLAYQNRTDDPCEYTIETTLDYDSYKTVEDQTKEFLDEAFSLLTKKRRAFILKALQKEQYELFSEKEFSELKQAIQEL